MGYSQPTAARLEIGLEPAFPQKSNLVNEEVHVSFPGCELARPCSWTTDAEVVVVQDADVECPYSQAAIGDLTSCTETWSVSFSAISPTPAFRCHARPLPKDCFGRWQIVSSPISNSWIAGTCCVTQRNWASNLPQFASELDSGEYRERIDRDIATRGASGVDSSPSFFLNGRLLQPSDTADLLETAQCKQNTKVGFRFMLVQGSA